MCDCLLNSLETTFRKEQVALCLNFYRRDPFDRKRFRGSVERLTNADGVEYDFKFRFVPVESTGNEITDITFPMNPVNLVLVQTPEPVPEEAENFPNRPVYSANTEEHVSNTPGPIGRRVSVLFKTLLTRAKVYPRRNLYTVSKKHGRAGMLLYTKSFSSSLPSHSLVPRPLFPLPLLSSFLSRPAVLVVGRASVGMDRW